MSSARDDAELNLRSLENAEQSNFDRLDYQERALKVSGKQNIANESDRKYEGFWCFIFLFCQRSFYVNNKFLHNKVYV